MTSNDKLARLAGLLSLILLPTTPGNQDASSTHGKGACDVISF